MRVAILSVSDKRHMSMVSPYIDYFCENHIPCDFIRADRYEIEDIRVVSGEVGDIYEYPFKQSTESRKLQKLIKFIQFRKFAIDLIKKNNYGFIIVWNENTAVLFSDFLIRKYKKRYCVNLRDFFEVKMLLPLFYLSVNNGCFATGPSPARIFSLKTQMITLFNRDTFVGSNAQKKQSISAKLPIRITYMGLYSASPRMFKKLVDVFKDDNRFVLQFYGDGFDTHLASYVRANHVSNVVTSGAFIYERTPEILNNTDIINGYYNTLDTNPNLKYVAGVKQSYTPLLYLPAIVDARTTWGKISKKYHFSFLIDGDPTEHLPTELYEWYTHINFEEFQKGCDSFNRIVDNTRKKLFDLLDKNILGR